LNEELAEIRERRASGEAGDEWKRRVERARAPIQAKCADHERQLEELSARWDALVDTGASGGERRAVLEALRERVLERNYIKNLLAAIERETSVS